MKEALGLEYYEEGYDWKTFWLVETEQSIEQIEKQDLELEAKIEKVQQEMRAAGIVEDSQEWLEEMEALNQV